jgi:hypothetical protein
VIRSLLGAIWLVAALLAPARADTPDRTARIESALRDVGAYAARVLVSESGKARADYDLLAGAWVDYESHWHTGQTALGLIEAWRITKDPQLLSAARRAGDWWISTEFQAPHPLAGLVNAAHGDRLGPLINFTTISDGAPGLFALSRATGDSRYADAATRSGRWLFANTAVPGERGLYYNIIEPDTGRIWTQRSPHHPDADPASVTQVARPNIEGYLARDMCRHTGDQSWCDLFLDHARTVVARQDPRGLWMEFEPNDQASGRVHPRFNIWNAEALVEAYELSRDRAFLEAATRTARTMAGFQDRSGGFAYDLNISGRSRPGSITGSATAFAGILWLRLRDHGVGGEFDDNIDRSIDWLVTNRFAPDHPDPNLAGAILETRVRTLDGRVRIAVRDIASAMGLRFLAMAWRDLHGLDVNETMP